MIPNLEIVNSTYIHQAIAYYEEIGKKDFLINTGWINYQGQLIVGFSPNKFYIEVERPNKFRTDQHILLPALPIIGYAHNKEFPERKEATPKNLSNELQEASAIKHLKENLFIVLDSKLNPL